MSYRHTIRRAPTRRIPRLQLALLGGALLPVVAGCAQLAPSTQTPQLRVAAEPLVGALGELSDVAEVGYGVSVALEAPLTELDGNDLYLEVILGVSQNEVSGVRSIPSGNPFFPNITFEVNDDATGVRFGIGGRLEFSSRDEFSEAPPTLVPFVDGGLVYWDFDSDLGSASGLGVYLGGGVDWPISESLTFGINAQAHLLGLDGAVDGFGLVPILGLSLAYRF